MPIHLQKNQTLLFIGDSITDAGRREQNAPLGGGYVRLFNDLAAVREPQKPLRILNRGIGGHTMDDLRSRWHEDVLSHRPDWLSIKIGINDCNRFLTGADESRYSPRAYREIYEQVLTLTRQTLPDTSIVLVAPFYISRDAVPNSYRAKVLSTLPEYIATVRDMSRQFETRFVDLHAAFARQLEWQHPDTYCSEPVHSNSTGALLIAEEIYRALSD